MYKKWREMYKSKLVTADEAAAMIRDGEVISSAFGNGQPIGLYEALRKRVMAGKLYKPTILAASMVQDLPLMDPEIEDRIEFDSFFVKSERSRIKEGYFTHTPNKFSDLEKISSRGLRSVQVSVLRVSPMDSHGFFSTGSMWTLAVVLLKGQSIRTCVKNLISIAHPDFRDELMFGAKKMGYLR
jgi:4-hydroxybutyrate CoA-transferase